MAIARSSLVQSKSLLVCPFGRKKTLKIWEEWEEEPNAPSLYLANFERYLKKKKEKKHSTLFPNTIANYSPPSSSPPYSSLPIKISKWWPELAYHDCRNSSQITVQYFKQ